MLDKEALAQAQAKGDDPGTPQINRIPASAISSRTRGPKPRP